MICRLEARRYRLFRELAVALGPLQVLIGPNATGKSTFLDLLDFLGTLVRQDATNALHQRTRTWQELVTDRETDSFSIAVECMLPELIVDQLAYSHMRVIRYEVMLGFLPDRRVWGIQTEKVFLKPISGPVSGPVPASLTDPGKSVPRLPSNQIEHESLPPNGTRTNLPTRSTQPAGTPNRGSTTVLIFLVDYLEPCNFFIPEAHPNGRLPWGMTSQELTDPQVSVLHRLPGDATIFPASFWLRDLLSNRLQRLSLSATTLQQPSAAAHSAQRQLAADNLPWVVRHLQHNQSKQFDLWVQHLHSILPDLQQINTAIQPDTGRCYLLVQEHNGRELPSWLLSAGTLRLFLLTLPAFFPDAACIYLIDEPEQGLYPAALEATVESLRLARTEVPETQFILASHSPQLIGSMEPQQLLCCQRQDDGTAQILSGVEHPSLRDWQTNVDLAKLFAAGALE